MTDKDSDAGGRWPQLVGGAPWVAGLSPVLVAIGVGEVWRSGWTDWLGWIFLALGVLIAAAGLTSQRRADKSMGLDAAGTIRLAIGLAAGLVAAVVVYVLLFTLEG